MRKYISLFFLPAIFVFACRSNSSGDGIIEQQKMTSLLTDVVIVDGSMYNVGQLADSLYKYGTGKYLDLFKRYNTDSAQFTKSFKYYTSQPVKLQAICDQVLDNLKKKTDSLNKLQLKSHAIPKK